VGQVKDILGSKGLDILINNIGIGQEGNLRPHQVTPEILHEQFEVNVIGPHLVTKSMLPLLQRGNKKIIVNMFDHPPSPPLWLVSIDIAFSDRLLLARLLIMMDVILGWYRLMERPRLLSISSPVTGRKISSPKVSLLLRCIQG
jgi:hypothetical protein